MICETIDLGEFDECDLITIDEITETTILRNEVTRWECSTDPDDAWGLVVGYYTFEINGQRYKFEVV